ncbi:hypothetical protein GGR35_002965 [Mucilaginibacter phyllosphaerae]|uniref:Uncharacterized protein n=1 Tax=Mucilaginibacter phyllosphaerae TaxID=1812349 RepID=A0ABR6IBA0_9SPHI|nr:hypothetical protein [Mucilaginibacter phyllosphaerae]
MALIWIFEKKKQGPSGKENLVIRHTFSKYGGVLFFVLLLAFLHTLKKGYGMG